MRLPRVGLPNKRCEALEPWRSAHSMRWLATVAPGSPEVQACCEAELALRGDRHTWAAVGLLRAGVVRDAVILAAVERSVGLRRGG